MRVAIDVRKIHDFGVGTYLRNLLDQLSRIDKQTEYVLFSRRGDLGLAKNLGQNFRTLLDPSPQYSIGEQVSIPLNILRSGAEIFHTPHYVLPALSARRSVVTIHDCIHLIFPQYLNGRLARLYARGAFWLAVRRANRILTVSESSKRDILRFFQVPEERVTVIYNAIEDHFYEDPAPETVSKVRERYQLNDRFIMYAGNIKPHKNVERLLDAFFLLRQNRSYRDLKLLVTGSEISKYSTLRRAVHRYNLHQHVRFLGYQPVETLSVLYRLAEVFVFPSLYEGFGLPPLEAMACGTPVVVSNVSSLPEVVGDAGILVNPYAADSIAEGIQAALDNNSLRARLSSLGIARARSFSWASSVKRVRDIYEEVAQ